jgi:hypothetical protein
MRTMASVRTEEPLPPNIQDCSVVRNNDDPVDEGYKNSLPFQPLVVFLRFLGVELDPALLYKSSKCFRYLLLGLCFLLLNAFFTIFTAVNEHNFFVQIYNMDTPTNSSSVENNSTVPSVFFFNLIVDSSITVSFPSAFMLLFYSFLDKKNGNFSGKMSSRYFNIATSSKA